MTPTITNDSSMADIRAILGSEAAPAAEPEPTPAASEPEAPATEENHEPVTEPGETKTEPETQEKDEPLPEGVQKRIAKEVEKAARAQAAIDRAVSERKAKEAELAKVKSDDKGSEPVKTPQSLAEKPKRPTFGEAGHENETWQQYADRESAHQDALASWIKAEAKREFQEESARTTAQRAAQERWDAAVKKHGKEFQTLMDSAVALAPEGLQVAISSLDNWSDVAVHLAKNPDKLKELAATFNQNQTKAIATLGRIEAAITAKTESKPATQPLPEPLLKPGGTASVSTATLQDSLEKGSMSQFKGAMQKLLK